MVADEGAPGLTTTARRPCAPHVLLDRTFADADAELQEFAADALRTPERIVCGHRLDERDDFRRESLRLTTGSGLSSPDDLEEVSMPAQQRLGIDDVQSVPPSAAQPGQDEQEQAIIVVEPRSSDAATQDDDLLTEQSILGQELRACAGEIPGGTDPRLRRRAGGSKQTLDCAAEGTDQGERVHGHGSFGWGFVEHDRALCEPEWVRQSSPLGHSVRRHRLAVSSLENPLFTRADIQCSQDAGAADCRTKHEVMMAFLIR